MDGTGAGRNRWVIAALLGCALERAGDFRILQATGVETEIDLPFAGLDQLVRPVLPLAERLPARQADALLGALGLVDHIGADRFLVAAATLSLLSFSSASRSVCLSRMDSSTECSSMSGSPSEE